MTTIMIRVRLVEDAAQALADLNIDVDGATGFHVAPGTTGIGAQMIRELRRMEAEDLVELDAALEDGYAIVDRIDGVADNPYAGTSGLRETIPTRTYVMRKSDEQASAAPRKVSSKGMAEALEYTLLTERGNVTIDLPFELKGEEGMPPLDDSDIQPIDPEQLRAAVAETEAFMAWKLAGGEGMPPEGFKTEDVQPVEREDPFSNEALISDLLRYQEALRVILYDVHQQVFDKGERLTKIADIAYAALNPKGGAE